MKTNHVIKEEVRFMGLHVYTNIFSIEGQFWSDLETFRFCAKKVDARQC